MLTPQKKGIHNMQHTGKRKHDSDEKVVQPMTRSKVQMLPVKPRIVTPPGWTAPILLVSKTLTIVTTRTNVFSIITPSDTASTSFVECFDLETGKCVLPYTPLHFRYSNRESNHKESVCDSYAYILGTRVGNSRPSPMCIMRLHPDPCEWIFVLYDSFTADPRWTVLVARFDELVFSSVIDVNNFQIVWMKLTSDEVTMVKSHILSIPFDNPNYVYSTAKGSEAPICIASDVVLQAADETKQHGKIAFLCYESVHSTWTMVTEINMIYQFGTCGEYLFFIDTSDCFIAMDMKRKQTLHRIPLVAIAFLGDIRKCDFSLLTHTDTIRLICIDRHNQVSCMQLGWTPQNTDDIRSMLPVGFVPDLIRIVIDYVGNVALLWTYQPEHITSRLRCMDSDSNCTSIWVYHINSFYVTFERLDEETGACVERGVIRGKTNDTLFVMPNGRPLICLE